ncbi:SDR family NAD(P)-dependent oxidoreductase [Allosaccharopolyspora coralli]|uniref:SDR family NAD(P)-dependent oxidoreductase n=1 Tax=Allosaccharopolyspora coralli TaxID=2665642 RepID=A0A5Q3Q8E0_9PSEU|nr:SDR family oxidoreductase [Allosaccharopolyspora coralli]QGK70643.1 SDR family NAD(P)-dependent oxidoreductase [Allosaccharopolyspora coralli]
MTVELTGKVVLVTGAAHGIGAALSRAFAERGAHVVAGDLDAEALHGLCAEIGAQAVAGNAADAQDVGNLVDTALAEHGRIDLFCANAGVDHAGGPEALDETWDHAWDVNVMAHVRAARAVLPHWLERGQGRFVSTVSAAGLLTMLGSAPYSVTKHAALAFAEWLAITYADRGITVQALCPQGVRTDMLARCGKQGQQILADSAVGVETVVESVLEALQDDRFLILPHPEVARYYAARAGDPDKWQGSMRKLQRMLDAG